jgi:hypothetical protein
MQVVGMSQLTTNPQDLTFYPKTFPLSRVFLLSFRHAAGRGVRHDGRGVRHCGGGGVRHVPPCLPPVFLRSCRPKWRHPFRQKACGISINPHFLSYAVIKRYDVYSALQLYFCCSKRN